MENSKAEVAAVAEMAGGQNAASVRQLDEREHEEEQEKHQGHPPILPAVCATSPGRLHVTRPAVNPLGTSLPRRGGGTHNHD